ncbi:carcinoembryonic antigen-related cell adhesion molecule 6-like [Phyllostomus hastatus]|uniref:carcinoembryonic antigen-related cell adhesion molecule 6-like n=1 Tax=Phyllostomus hastatus TaxID=9423 RepID=UPI001E6827AD|nr:carcinoembryonic antigen-related cell adhesion molecule 6-like [Phyllostomus hastatus]
MESPSAPARRGRVPQQGLLLAISLLTFRSPPSTAQLTVASTSATEGKDVLLLVLNLPENTAGYSWFRGASTDSKHGIGAFSIETQKLHPRPAHSRETIYPNGSLLFQKVTLNDTGYYTIVVTKKDFLTEKATGQLTIYRPVTYKASQSTDPQHPPLARVPLEPPSPWAPSPAPGQPAPSMRTCCTRAQTCTAASAPEPTGPPSSSGSCSSRAVGGTA